MDIIRPTEYIKKKYFAKKAKTQLYERGSRKANIYFYILRDLNKSLSPPEFAIEKVYATLLTTVFSTFMFSSGFPVLPLLSCVSKVVDKKGGEIL